MKAKMYLEGRLTSGGVRGDTEDIDAAKMLSMLQAVEELMKTEYVAVGILEHWDSSMLLFDRALEMPNYSWVNVSSTISAHNSNKMKGKNHVLAAAFTDSELAKHIWLDLILYDFAVSVHKEQLAHYNLD